MLINGILWKKVAKDFWLKKQLFSIVFTYMNIISFNNNKLFPR